AHGLSAAIHRREVSCREVMQAYLARIDVLNPRFNAIVNLAPADALLAQADVRDAELAAGRSRGWMHGMPQAIKDAAHAAGFPTTLGCVLLKDSLATEDSLIARRAKEAGAIVVGKTNVPEFGLGSHTFNDLFGCTGNAWDPTLSAGGCSGGASVALALRMLPVADGSDFMGSLRNPAGWNNVFGMRPSQGRVPGWPSPERWVSQLATEGPLARNVRDLALLLQTQAGGDPRVPLAQAGEYRCVPADDVNTCALKGLRIGWLGDLGGHLAMEPGVLEVCQSALSQLEGAGAVVVQPTPGFDPEQVWRAWLTWRRALSGTRVAGVMHLPDAQRLVKPEAQWEYEQMRGLAFSDFMAASVTRTSFHASMLDLFEACDVLVLPSAQTWPFPTVERWPRHIAGRTMDTYHRWMEVTIYASFAGLPGLAMPAGFDATGRLPMGLQLIGKPFDDAGVLRIAAACEQVLAPVIQRQPFGSGRSIQQA
ncbi:MAG: amidase, partial [Rubrivivax sp.]